MKKRNVCLACLVALMFGSIAVFAQTAGKPITFEEAMKIALERIGGGIVWDVELEQERVGLVYEVEIRKDGIKYDVYINAMTKEVLRVQEEGRYNANNRMPPCFTTAKITVEQAKAIALRRTGGTIVEEVEFERKGNQLLYEIEVRVNRRDVEVIIDAVTGRVSRVR